MKRRPRGRGAGAAAPAPAGGRLPRLGPGAVALHACARSCETPRRSTSTTRSRTRVRDRLVHRWLATQRTHVEKDVKRVCYFSSEFLTGRSLGLCLMNMSLYDAAVEVAADYGLELGQVLECEGDPGLGNGGLGRLAACFMDSLATLELPAIGYGSATTSGCSSRRSTAGAKSSSTILKRRRSPKGIVGENAEKLLRLRPETRRSQTTRVLLRLLCEDELPGRHQPGSFSHRSIGVASPSAMDSRMPGTERRYRVS